jgi:CheY-like chemotaxis protein
MCGRHLSEQRGWRSQRRSALSAGATPHQPSGSRGVDAHSLCLLQASSSSTVSPMTGYSILIDGRILFAMPDSLIGVRVVVVEDHGDSREILDQMLAFYGAIVTTASTALDALAAAPDADIIVTDFALPPGEDGVWLLEQVNRHPRPIPVVLVSGFSEHQDARLAAAPFARKLLKPIEPERLCEEIAEVLRGSAV